MKRRGFTLVELVVVIGLTSILGTIAFSYIIQAAKDNRKLQSQTEIQASLSLALDRVNRIVRSTTNLISADAVSLKLYGYPNAGDVAPSQIYFRISGGKVVYDVTPPTGTAPNYTYNPANTKTFTLLLKVTNSVNLPLFFYYDATNTILTSPPPLASVHAIAFAPSVLDSGNVLTIPVSAQTYDVLRNFKTNL